jgi:hypothetical protein
MATEGIGLRPIGVVGEPGKVKTVSVRFVGVFVIQKRFDFPLFPMRCRMTKPSSCGVSSLMGNIEDLRSEAAEGPQAVDSSAFVRVRK